MKNQHAISVNGAPAPKPDTFRLRFLSAFIRTLQYSLTFSLSYSQQDCYHHFTHFTIGADPIINKPDSYALGIKRFYQLDHNCRMPYQ